MLYDLSRLSISLRRSSNACEDFSASMSCPGHFAIAVLVRERSRPRFLFTAISPVSILAQTTNFDAKIRSKTIPKRPNGSGGKSMGHDVSLVRLRFCFAPSSSRLSPRFPSNPTSFVLSLSQDKADSDTWEVHPSRQNATELRRNTRHGKR